MQTSSGSEAASGGISAIPLQGGKLLPLFYKGAWRDELPEAAPEACDEAGSTSQSS